MAARRKSRGRSRRGRSSSPSSSSWGRRILLTLAGMALVAWLGGPGVLEQLWSRLPTPPVEARQGPVLRAFEVLEGARLLPGPNNDGDSFKITHEGRVHEFRLYFADCPEKTLLSLNEERLREQGAYFGGLSVARTVALGQQARHYTHRWLTERPFTVLTRWQPVFDSGRHYAFIQLSDGEYLSTKLVREGLARIHTTGTVLPDNTPSGQYETQLKALEDEARAARRGGWAP